MMKRTILTLIGLCLLAGWAAAEHTDEDVYFDTPLSCVQYFSSRLNAGDTESALLAFDSAVRSLEMDEEVYAAGYGVMTPTDALQFPKDYIAHRELLYTFQNMQQLHKILQNLLIPPEWPIKEALLSNSHLPFAKDTMNFTYHNAASNQSEDSGVSLQDYYGAMAAQNLADVQLYAVLQYDYKLQNPKILQTHEAISARYGGALLEPAECIIVYSYKNALYAIPMTFWRYAQGWKIHEISSLFSGLLSVGEQIQSLDEFYEKYIRNSACSLVYETPELAQKRITAQELIGTWKVPLNGDHDQITFSKQGTAIIDTDGRRGEAQYAIHGPYLRFVVNETNFIAFEITPAQDGFTLDGLPMVPVQ